MGLTRHQVGHDAPFERELRRVVEALVLAAAAGAALAGQRAAARHGTAVVAVLAEVDARRHLAPFAWGHDLDRARLGEAILLQR